MIKAKTVSVSNLQVLSGIQNNVVGHKMISFDLEGVLTITAYKAKKIAKDNRQTVLQIVMSANRTRGIRSLEPEYTT